ncbi:MAG: DNA primase [Proteobacteria bacterium]|nr:DNA primase [Pseudomonadota bacterium]
MTFTPQFLDDIRARVPLSDTIGRRVRLVRRGREHVGLCPFHKEKTPSFTVNEDKGFFHCFGCGAHGDVIGFEMRIDNLTFPEAVERLARAASLELPVHTPQDRERAKERTSLYTVVETAAAWFQEQLSGSGGAAGREYLERRGLDAATIAKFRLGWAPDSRNALKRALTGPGISETMLVAAGLLIAPEDGGASYDRFRGRIIFPITDRGGKVVAFGGRALGEGTPKYLNSPETPLFHKGDQLYGVALARNPAREAGEVIVAEGYMDVIALSRAGFENAVAPLGTALTEAQIQELWRLAPEPIVCFDGDAAGQRAAHRAAERALALLRPGLSLRFAALPPGDDPDSVIAKGGAPAMRDALGAARPLADVLWTMESTGRPLDTPERRADLEARLYARARQIDDAAVRRHYERHFRSCLWKAFSPSSMPAGRDKGMGRSRGGPTRKPVPEPPLAHSLGIGADGQSERRERLLVTMILNRPELLAKVEEEFAALDMTSPQLDDLRRAILSMPNPPPDLDSAALKNHLSNLGFLAAVEHLSAPGEWSERRLEDKFARPDLTLAVAEMGWRHVLSCHSQAVGLKAELRAAEEALAENMNDENLARFEATRRQMEREIRADVGFGDWDPEVGNLESGGPSPDGPRVA